MGKMVENILIKYDIALLIYTLKYDILFIASTHVYVF